MTQKHRFVPVNGYNLAILGQKRKPFVYKDLSASRAISTAFRKSHYYARARLLRRFAPRNDIGLHSSSLRARRSRAWQSRSRTISEMEY